MESIKEINKKIKHITFSMTLSISKILTKTS